MPEKPTCEGLGMRRPVSSEYAPEYAGYVNLVPEDDIITMHEQQLAEVLALLGPVAPWLIGCPCTGGPIDWRSSAVRKVRGRSSHCRCAGSWNARTLGRGVTGH